MADGTDPTIPPRKDPAQAMAENVRFMRENGYSAEEIKAEIQRWAPKIAAFNAAEMQREDPMGLTEMSPTAGKLKAGARAGLETFQTVAAGFPGAQLAMSGLRAATSGIPVAEAQRQIQREVTDQGIASGAARMVGGVPMLAAGGAIAGRAPQAMRGALQAAGQTPYIGRVARAVAPGATMGAVEQALSGAPEAAGNRLERAGQGALIGGVMTPVVGGASRVGFAVRDLTRALRTPSPDVLSDAMSQALKARTAPMYQAAEAAGRVTQGPVQTFGQPGIREYVDEILSSPSFQKKHPNPSQQDILKAVREHILDAQKAAESAAATQATTGVQRVRAATRLSGEDARVLAQRLLDESDYFTQGQYRQAVSETAQGKAAERAGVYASDVANAAIRGTRVPARQIPARGLAPCLRQVPKMAPEEVQAALPMARAELAQAVRLSPDIREAFGVPRAIAAPLRARKVLGPLEEAAAGRPLAQPKTIRDYLLAAGTGY
jgi:hypothetical protein